MDRLKFARNLQKVIKSEVENFAQKNASDTTLKITSVGDGFCSGTTPTGKAIRGVAHNGESVGQQIGAQRGRGAGWQARGAVYKSE